MIELTELTINNESELNILLQSPNDLIDEWISYIE